ncbi:MAG: hypothetical protein AAGH72_10620 [Verrucomicrobiota bacterium]
MKVITPILVTLVAAVTAQAQIVLDFAGAGGAANGSVQEFTLTSTAVAPTATFQIGNNPTGNLSSPGNFGTISITYTGLNADNALGGGAFDPNTFTGGEADGFSGNVSGIGISGGTNGGLSVGEAIILTFDLSSYTGPQRFS